MAREPAREALADDARGSEDGDGYAAHRATLVRKPAASGPAIGAAAPLFVD
jgi:hypothetical protein